MRGHGPGDGHALRLAAGELVGVALGQGPDAEIPQQRGDALVGARGAGGGVAGIRSAVRAVLQPEPHVLGGRAPGQQVRLLEHRAGGAAGILRPAHRSGCRLDESREQREQRGLAGTRRADHGQQFAAVQREVDVVQHAVAAAHDAGGPHVDDGEVGFRLGHACSRRRGMWGERNKQTDLSVGVCRHISRTAPARGPVRAGQAAAMRARTMSAARWIGATSCATFAPSSPPS